MSLATPKSLILASVFALASCSHQPAAIRPAPEAARTFDTLHRSPDSALELRMRGGHPHFQYELKERESGKLLGRAESDIGIDHVSETGIRGGQTITFSPGNRAICIVENTSDASPRKRYVLFQKTSSGRYSTRYLRPPLDLDPTILTFEGDFPDVIALTNDTITFSKAVGPPVPQKFDAVPQSSTPQSAHY